MSESAERMRRIRKRLKENDELYQELKEKERKRQKIITDQKKAERVQDSVKLKQYREYEEKGKQNKGRKRKLLNSVVLNKMEERHLGKELEEPTW